MKESVNTVNIKPDGSRNKNTNTETIIITGINYEHDEKIHKRESGEQPFENVNIFQKDHNLSIQIDAIAGRDGKESIANKLKGDNNINQKKILCVTNKGTPGKLDFLFTGKLITEGYTTNIFGKKQEFSDEFEITLAQGYRSSNKEHNWYFFSDFFNKENKKSTDYGYLQKKDSDPKKATYKYKISTEKTKKTIIAEDRAYTQYNHTPNLFLIAIV